MPKQCRRSSPPALVPCPSSSALARRRRRPPQSKSSLPLRLLRCLSSPPPPILVVVVVSCLRQPSLQYLVRHRCRHFLSAADILVISRPPVCGRASLPPPSPLILRCQQCHQLSPEAVITSSHLPQTASAHQCRQSLLVLQTTFTYLIVG